MEEQELYDKITSLKKRVREKEIKLSTYKIYMYLIYCLATFLFGFMIIIFITETFS